MVIVLDTSGLLAAIDSSQRFHEDAKETLGRAVGLLILSPFVLAELDYLLAMRVGREAELALLQEVARETYRLAAFLDRGRGRGKADNGSVYRLAY